MTRAKYYESLLDKPNTNLIKYQTAKAKKLLRTFNYRLSEVKDELAVGHAINMHHIFLENEFKEISGYVENLIALTFSHHFQRAYVHGNTRIINKAFQQIRKN